MTNFTNLLTEETPITKRSVLGEQVMTVKLRRSGSGAPVTVSAHKQGNQLMCGNRRKYRRGVATKRKVRVERNWRNSQIYIPLSAVYRSRK